MAQIRILKAVALTLILGMVFTLIASAYPGVVDGPNFEIDGNTAQTEGADDWETVIYGTDWAEGPGYLILDGSSGPKAVVPEENIFAKGGKFADPTSWVIEPGNTPAQNDLTNIYVYPVIEGKYGDSWMVMGMERIKKQGTFDLDFEYNQVGWDGNSGTLVRTEGDIVVGFELSGNPDDPSADLSIVILIYEPSNAACTGWEAVYGGGFCEVFRGSGDELALSNYGVATMNSTGFDQPPWGSYQSSGALLPDGEQVAPFFFAEAAINLSALGVEPACPGFGTVHAKSRSSLEITADLKDLAGPQALPVNCWIEGSKYLDVNGNGQWDNGEPPLEGWEIQLGGAGSATTYTDAEGHYIFENLADGAYNVTEICPEETPAWFQTEPEYGAVACGADIYSFGIDIDHRVYVGDFGNGQPDISVEKTCPSDVFLGDDIDYTITVTNTGNVDLYNIEVVDTLLGNFGPVNLLAGEDEVFTDSMLATTLGDVTNTADVTGYYPDDLAATVYVSVSDTDDCTTTVWGLTVDKTADEFYRRYFEWDISKSVTPASWDLFNGESGESKYTVELDQTGFYDNDWKVTGEITVNNPAPMDATLDSVSDMISDYGPVSVYCASLIVPAEDSITCTYDTGEIDSVDDNLFGVLNIATATLLNNNTRTTDFQGTAEIAFGDPSELVDEEATVSDTYAGSNVAGTFTGDHTFTYFRTFTCGGDAGQHDNTASFVTNDTLLTGQDDASVMVTCHELSVSKTVETFYRRYFEWDITKTVDPATWDLFDGETGESKYTVELLQTGSYDNDWKVSGEITISNPAPMDAELTGVVDGIADFGAADVHCDSLIVPAGDSITCTYETEEQDAADANPFGALNTATATQQLYDYDYLGGRTLDDTAEYAGSADVVFGEPSELVDEEAMVSDTYGGSTVSGTYTDGQTFTYYREFTCDADEGTWGNTASFETFNTPLSGSADASVTVNCYSLSMEKNSHTSYQVQYFWYIDKSVNDPGPITVMRGDSVDVTYTVEVGLDGDPVASLFSAWGNVVIYNHHPTRDANLDSVIDSISGYGPPDAFSCSSLIVPANGSLTCTYNTSLPNWNDWLNEAWAEQILSNFAYDGTPSYAGLKEYSTSHTISFAGATVTYIDEEVDVEDSYAGFLGTLTAGPGGPWYFTYDRTITAPEAFCGEFRIDNEAWYLTNDTATTESAFAYVDINVPCEGCTPGFWQGGAGSQLWDQEDDPQWVYGGTNPFIHTTLFNDFFNVEVDDRLDGQTMLQIVGNDGGSGNSAEKAARDMVAAYLNESSFSATFPAPSLSALEDMWYAAVLGGDEALEDFHIIVASWNDPSSIGGYCPLP
ncbi:DUF11 domain-containing protein [bacterium]|nr:DUF11 domain-containing protein [bacterium]